MPQFTTENVCYVKHGERQIMARVFKPEGAGPFPCFIDLHGGAWNNGDLEDRTGLGEYLAARGTVMVTLNFRHAADGYPTSCADINYGIRWTKAHAKELKVDPAKVFIGGASSGGQWPTSSIATNGASGSRSRIRCAMCAPETGSSMPQTNASGTSVESHPHVPLFPAIL